MSDSISDADKVIQPLLQLLHRPKTDVVKIRNKRLAKLGSQSSSQVGATGERSGDGASVPQPVAKTHTQDSGDSEEKEQARPKINISKTSDPPISPSNPFSQLGLKTNSKAPAMTIGSSAGRPITPMKRDRPSSANENRGSRAGESIEAWENRILGAIFRLTLDSAISQDIHGHPLHFLEGVRNDLEDQNEPVILSTAVLDQALLEAASSLEKSTPLDYLLECWKRITKQLRNFKGANTEDPKYGIIREARRLCMSYCLFAVTMPDMFG